MSLVADIQLMHAIAAAESKQSAMGYLRNVVINSDPEPRRFLDLAEPWQWDRAGYILPAVEAVTGHNPNYTGPRNIWETMPRGHDKTSFIGRMLNWVLCFSKRKNLRMVVAAKDSDQANILKDFMKMEASLNPWFGNQLTFHQQIVIGPAGHLRVATADAKGLFGHNLDLIVLEEMTHWEEILGPQVWTSLWSGRRKRKSAVMLVLSNAGFIDSWQHKIFTQAKKTPLDWYIFEAPGIMASWMDREAIARDRLLLPPAEARRLLDNIWIDPGEESGYLTRAEVEACIQEATRRGLAWTQHLNPSLEYILSIDYGPKKDRTVLCLGHQLGSGELAVDRFWVWEGRNYQGHEVPIHEIRRIVEETRREAPRLQLIIDPYQLKELAQSYQGIIPVEQFEARGGKSNYEMAECLRTQIVLNRLLWPPGLGDLPLGVGSTQTEIGDPGAFAEVDGLLEELTRLILRPMSYGYRFDHLAGRHDDRAVALGMMCVACFKRPRPQEWIQTPRDTINKKTPDPFKDRRSHSGRELWGVRV